MIKTNLTVRIPNFVIGKRFNEVDFLFPFYQQEWKSEEAPLKCCACSVPKIDGHVLEVAQRDYSGKVYVSLTGEIYVGIIDNRPVEPGKILETVKLIPDLFKWGRKVRKDQDALKKEMENLLGVKLRLKEGDRLFFKDEHLSKVKSLIKKFEESNETFNSELLKGLSVKDELQTKLERQWNSTPTARKAAEESAAEYKKVREAEDKERAAARSKKEAEITKILVAAGLI